MHPLPIRIRISQRIIISIAITVEVLGVAGVLDVVVGREHPSQIGVVESAVHIYQTESIQMFVSGVASVESEVGVFYFGGGQVCPSGGAAAV